MPHSATSGESALPIRDLSANLARAGIGRVFIAAPMSAFGDDSEYQASREAILGLRKRLVDDLGLDDAYYAGASVASTAAFDGPDNALESDLRALLAADLFVLLYPRKVLSSVLIETGYALALRKPTLIMVRNRADLPFLLRQAEDLSGRDPLPVIHVAALSDDAGMFDAVRHGLSGLMARRAAAPSG